MKRGRETKPGNGIPDRPPHNIPMPKVKEPKETVSGITIDVDCKGIDEALVKARELVGVLQKIDGLTGRIKRDLLDIDRYAVGGRLTGSGDNPRPARD